MPASIVARDFRSATFDISISTLNTPRDLLATVGDHRPPELITGSIVASTDWIDLAFTTLAWFAAKPQRGGRQ